MKTRLNGLEMNWERHGPESGTPVVLIHGFPFAAAMWDPQITALGREFPLITYDLRGFGASEAPAEAFHFEAFVDDLAALLDHLGSRKAILCGLSMGGYVALRFTERHPERVAGLALCATRSDADTDAMKIRRAIQARTIRLEGVAPFADSFVKAVFAEGAAPAEVDRMRKIIVSNSARAIISGLVALSTRTDTTPSLGGFRTPTLIVVGSEDTVTEARLSHAMNAEIKGSKLVELPGAGHMCNLERPQEFNSALGEFLRSV